MAGRLQVCSFLAIEAGKIVEGAPGTFSIAPAALAGAVPGALQLDRGQAILVQSAILRSNSAAPIVLAGDAKTDPSAVIESVAKGLTAVANTPADVKILAARAKGVIHWWGWTLVMDEEATQALVRLLRDCGRGGGGVGEGEEGGEYE